MSEHMLQAAALAEAESADDALVAAALLHDVGHYADEFSAYSPTDTADKRHEDLGAELLAPYFDRRIVVAVRLHVSAKRYLCANDPNTRRSYLPLRCTLALQGTRCHHGKLAFKSHAGFADAVRIRVWDDSAKVPGVATRSFDDYARLLRRVLRVQN